MKLWRATLYDESVSSADAAFLAAFLVVLFKDNAIFGERFFVRIEEVFRLLSRLNLPKSSTRLCASRARALSLSLACEPCMKLSVLIPVWNEGATLLEILEQVRAVPVEKEIILVDDGSTDGTRDILQSLIESGQAQDENGNVKDGNVENNDLDLRIVLQEHGGKGVAVRRALSLARGDWIVVQDADLEYDPNDFVRLLAFAQKKRGRCVAVFGTRLLKGSPSRANQAQHSRTAFYYGRIGLSVWFRVLYGAPVSDVATCYKMVRRDVLQSFDLRGRGFELDFEIAARLARSGHRIWEVPVWYQPRSVLEGKKIKVVRDGLRAAWTLLKLRFL